MGHQAGLELGKDQCRALLWTDSAGVVEKMAYVGDVHEGRTALQSENPTSALKSFVHG